MPKILFVCSANRDRSKTADDHFSRKYPDIQFQSAGTNRKLCMQLGTEPITEKHLQWADKIIVMEEKHREFIRSISKEKVGAKLTVLGIPDIYEYNQKELIALLEEKVDSIINPSL